MRYTQHDLEDLCKAATDFGVKTGIVGDTLDACATTISLNLEHDVDAATLWDVCITTRGHKSLQE